MSDEKTLLVRATKIGYYGDERRYPAGHGHPKSGNPFKVKVSEFSDSTKKVGLGRYGWMEIVEGTVESNSVEATSTTNVSLSEQSETKKRRKPGPKPKKAVESVI